MTFAAYLLGFLAATSNAGANVLQRVANRDEGTDREFSWQLVKDLLHKPVWYAGIGCITGSFVFQAAGLGFGTLAAVEPLLVLELPITLLMSRLWLGGRLDRGTWSSIIAMTLATMALIGFLGPSGGRTTGISWLTYVIAGGLTAAVIGVCYGLGVRWRQPGRRAAVLGIGTGTAYGLAAAFTKGMTGQFGSGGIVGILTAWQLYTAIVAGLFAVWMHQNAVSAGRLVVAQPGTTLADPYVSILWGAAVYSEAMRDGLWIVPAVLAGAVMTAAAITLSRSSQTSGPAAVEELR